MHKNRITDGLLAEISRLAGATVEYTQFPDKHFDQYVIQRSGGRAVVWVDEFDPMTAKEIATKLLNAK